MADDYVPQDDARFDLWQANLIDYAAANLSRWGLTSSALTALTALRARWGADFPAALQAQNAANTAITRRVTTRTDYEPALRVFSGQLQTNPAVTDDDKRAMELTIHKTTRTAGATPTTAPQGVVDVARLQHTLNFVDAAMPQSKAKPAGAHGCEIWWKLGGPAPTGANDLKFLALDTRTPYVNHFEMAQAGQTAYYMMRWQDESGAYGPWSTLLLATVAA